MRLLIQRVTRASVRVDGAIVGEIGRGLVVLVGVTSGDTNVEVEYLANKTAHLRVFEDTADKMNLSALDTQAEILVVSQFTLYADTRRGRRPDLFDAAPPDVAEPLIDAFATLLEGLGLRVARGRFRARMLIEILNDGPVTIWIDSGERKS